MEKVIITQETTVYKALTDYPKLKEVLIGISPKFKKLQNPVMFNSIAKVTPFKAAAKVGGIYIHELLSQLNEAIGLKQEYLDYHNKQIPKMQEEFMKKQFSDEPAENTKPKWMEKVKDFEMTDVRLKGEPFNLVTAKAEKLKVGEGFCIVQGFRPQPILDFLKNKGYESYVDKKSDDEYNVYFYKKEGE